MNKNKNIFSNSFKALNYNLSDDSLSSNNSDKSDNSINTDNSNTDNNDNKSIPILIPKSKLNKNNNKNDNDNNNDDEKNKLSYSLEKYSSNKDSINFNLSKSYESKSDNNFNNNQKELNKSYINQTQNSNELESFFYEKNKSNYNTFYCVNCGKKGHTSKKCNLPIISIGIICIYIQGININLNEIINYSKKLQNNYLFSNDEIEEIKNIYSNLKNIDREELKKKINYLMIRRKNSLSYVDFMRGKYDIDDYEYIFNTIYMMTEYEQQNLINNKFEDLWKELWSTTYLMNYSQEYEESKNKFDKLKKGYNIQKNDINFFINFKNIIEFKNKIYKEPEWGFPKGRRDINEKNIDCGKREFKEETGIKEEDYFILNLSPIEETYLGTNHIRYKHIYYYAQIPKYIIIDIDNNNEHQKIEVGDIKLLTFEEANNKIREYHMEKKNVLNNSNHFIINMILNFKKLVENYFK